MVPFAVAVVFLIGLAGSTPAAAEPALSIQHTTYAVSGRTATQIRRSLDRNSPVRQGNKIFDAYTKWDVDWRLRWFEDGDGRCRLISVTTDVRIRMTLPELQDRDALSPDLADRWQRYMRALAAHEQGHADIGIAAARAIEAQLPLSGERPSCDRLASEANALAREIIARHARMEVQYDADTWFGDQDGAIFP